MDSSGARWCEEHGRRECVHRKHGGGQCHARAMRGLDSCRTHAGSRERIGYAKALALRPAAAGHWQPIRVHPAEALLQEVHYHAGLCAWLDSIVAGLERGEMTWGLTRRRVTSGSDGAEEQAEWAAQVNTWVAWQERAHRAKAQVARLALETLAEESLLRMTEAQAARTARAFEEGLSMLELSERQWGLAREHYPVILRRLGEAA